MNRTAVPALASEVRRLRSERDEALTSLARFLEIEQEKAAALRELDEAREALRAERDALSERFLMWRGIETYNGEKPCTRCSGAGRRAYGSTATWRGGIGGQAMTSDVCDRCWGSGVEGKPWPSHRLLRALSSAGGGEGGEFARAGSTVEGSGTLGSNSPTPRRGGGKR